MLQKKFNINQFYLLLKSQDTEKMNFLPLFFPRIAKYSHIIQDRMGCLTDSDPLGLFSN